MELICGNCTCKYRYQMGCKLKKVMLDGEGRCRCFALSPAVAVRDYLDSLPPEPLLMLRSEDSADD